LQFSFKTVTDVQVRMSAVSSIGVARQTVILLAQPAKIITALYMHIEFHLLPRRDLSRLRTLKWSQLSECLYRLCVKFCFSEFKKSEHGERQLVDSSLSLSITN